MKVLISRTDAIGDVVLTIPICSILKEYSAVTEIHFLGRTYTEDVVRCCSAVDQFVNVDALNKLPYPDRIEWLKREKYDAIVHVYPNKKIAKLAKEAEIPIRVGTTNRWFHWPTCNKLIPLRRRNSDLHESQLNIKLLSAFGIERSFSLEEIGKHFKMDQILPLPERLRGILDDSKLNVILHPKSNKSAREWGLDHFSALINLLPKERFRIFISGVQSEESSMADWIKSLPDHVFNMVGKMSLSEFISFIYYSNGLVSASTGPLHIAAGIGNNALGLYPAMRPLFPKRWAPLGPRAHFLVSGKDCTKCEVNPSVCECMREISPGIVARVVNQWTR